MEALVEVFLLQVFLYSILLLLISRILDGIEVTDYGQALLAAFVLSVLNALIKPVLALISLPLIIITLGLFVFVINAALLMLTSSIVPGFRVRSFGTALLASLLLSIFTLGWSLMF
jgi:putative membrane protein